eukprot:COSAG01_NODE_2397_length_7771_cov_12.578076_8_plen_219_part_00
MLFDGGPRLMGQGSPYPTFPTHTHHLRGAHTTQSARCACTTARNLVCLCGVRTVPSATLVETAYVASRGPRRRRRSAARRGRVHRRRGPRRRSQHRHGSAGLCGTAACVQMRTRRVTALQRWSLAKSQESHSCGSIAQLTGRRRRAPARGAAAAGQPSAQQPRPAVRSLPCKCGQPGRLGGAGCLSRAGQLCGRRRSARCRSDCPAVLDRARSAYSCS